MVAQQISPQTKADLERDEGLCLTAYPDPRSPLALACRRLGIPASHYVAVPNWRTISGAPWTIGYGTTGPGIAPGVVWNLAQAETALAQRAQAAADGLVAAQPWIDALDEVRRSALINAAYNLGVQGLLNFHHAISALEAGNYEQSALDFQQSLWYNQVGKRADRICNMIRTGKR